MGKQVVVEYTCDRCPTRKSESEFKRTGGATITIAELKDKRKKSTADLCGDCVRELTGDLTMSKAKDAKETVERPHLAEVI